MKLFVVVLNLIFILASSGQTQPETPSLLNFSAIKDVLKNDMLDGDAKKKEDEIVKAKQSKQDAEVAKYNIPSGDNFWDILSEYWLIKNASVLKWDFKKPDYGVEAVFKEMLEKHGQYERQFRILYLDAPVIFHAYLPSSKNSLLFVVSVPFIKTLDLSKVEIAMLLYEDFLRASRDTFINKLLDEKSKLFIGSNFYGKKFDKNQFDSIQSKYSEILFKNGFTFQEQFEVTNQMNEHLKVNLNEWTIYYKLLEKIDQLVKTNVLFRDYLKLYPSPELQLGWLRPKPLGQQ